jgi:hypothetical protein
MSRFLRVLGLALCATALLSSGAKADPDDYGIESFDVFQSTTQAGAHPNLHIDLAFDQKPGGGPHANTREIVIDLPPGSLGNPNAVPRCTTAQLVGTDVNNPTNETSCPVDSQVGLVTLTLGGTFGSTIFTEPMYNMVPPPDAVARFGFYASTFVVVVDAELRSESDYGITLTSKGIGAIIPLSSIQTTTWGVPADQSHDTERITPYEALHCAAAPCTAPGKLPRQSGVSPTPFLYNPTFCAGPRIVTVTARSYPRPDQPVSASAALPQVSGCGKLGFDPELSLTPTSREAATPTGLDTSLTVPQNETVNGLATSQLRRGTVVLPQGMTIAPGAADGLTSCSAAQVKFGTRLSAACPESAKIATIEIDSPPLARPLEGAVYQRTPVKGDLFGIWLVADDLGLHLKLPGKVMADPITGQLTALFEGTPQTEGLPQAPVRSFELNFKSGPRAPLATPQNCGIYSATYELAPWSGGPSVSGTAPMTFDQNCATGGFSPDLAAGTTNPVGGVFAPFLTTLSRDSNEQNISTLQIRPPSGVLAKLAGIPLCQGLAATNGECPAASLVGIGTVAVGPGTAPLFLPQAGKKPIEVFLSGPYKGAQLSLIVSAPAQAGPFDLGTVVTRAAVRIDPTTARATVISDPLPQILEGVPISYRVIHVNLDRPDFTLNPTSCAEKMIDATIFAIGGASASIAERFQVSGCRDLGFRPRLALRLKGPTRRASNPRLIATLKARPGDANIATAQVKLPRAAFLDQGHIKTICTRVQFAADTCPAGSIYGKASATSPLLDYPLTGKVYLRSSSNPLPDLVVALDGPAHQPIEIDLVGRTDSVKGALRNTFEAVPDAPVSSFRLELFGGRRGLVELSRNLCKGRYRATVKLDAQNGKAHDTRPKVGTSCSKKKRKQPIAQAGELHR